MYEGDWHSFNIEFKDFLITDFVSLFKFIVFKRILLDTKVWKIKLIIKDQALGNKIHHCNSIRQETVSNSYPNRIRFHDF